MSLVSRTPASDTDEIALRPREPPALKARVLLAALLLRTLGFSLESSSNCANALRIFSLRAKSSEDSLKPECFDPLHDEDCISSFLEPINILGFSLMFLRLRFLVLCFLGSNGLGRAIANCVTPGFSRISIDLS